MKKLLTYEGYCFVLRLTFGRSTLPAGQHPHTLLVTHTGAANYQQTHEVHEATLEQDIAAAEQHAKRWADERRR